MSPTIQKVLWTAGAFALGYASTEVATGFRYSIAFDWMAIMNGILCTGLYHSDTIAGFVPKKDG